MKCLGCNASPPDQAVEQLDPLEPGWICFGCGYWNIPGEDLAAAHRAGASVTVQRGKEWQAEVEAEYEETKAVMDAIRNAMVAEGT